MTTPPPLRTARARQASWVASAFGWTSPAIGFAISASPVIRSSDAVPGSSPSGVHASPASIGTDAVGATSAGRQETGTVIVSVTPGGQKLAVFDKATPGTVVERTADEPLEPKDFWIGAETGASLGPVRMYIDDVVIHR